MIIDWLYLLYKYQVNEQLRITPGPWFLQDLSIVDLTYITHVERMAASIAYWTGIKIRGSGKWLAVGNWMDAFEVHSDPHKVLTLLVTVATLSQCAISSHNTP